MSAYETLLANQMGREARKRGERSDQVVAMKDELWAWAMKQYPAARTNEVLRALAWFTEMYVHVPVEGETPAVRRRLRKWGKHAYTFGRRCGV